MVQSVEMRLFKTDLMSDLGPDVKAQTYPGLLVKLGVYAGELLPVGMAFLSRRTQVPMSTFI